MSIFFPCIHQSWQLSIQEVTTGQLSAFYKMFQKFRLKYLQIPAKPDQPNTDGRMMALACNSEKIQK